MTNIIQQCSFECSKPEDEAAVKDLRENAWVIDSDYNLGTCDGLQGNGVMGNIEKEGTEEQENR